jgi:hypothetical protein
MQVPFSAMPISPPAGLIATKPAISPHRKLHNKQRRFMLVYLAALLIAFSPSKALGLIGPFIVLAGLIFFVQIRPIHHLQKMTLAGLVFVWIGICYWLLVPEFWWPNYFLVAITFSAAFFLLFDFSSILDTRLIRRLGRLTLLFIFFQSVYGIAQFALAIATYGYRVSIGDLVWGTLAPPNQFYYAGTSPFFVLLISSLLLFTFAATPPRISFNTIVGLSTVALCWMVASLLHSVVFFVFAVILALAFLALLKPRRRNQHKDQRRGLFVAVILIGILVGVGILVHPDNYQRISSVLGSIADLGPNARFGKLRTIYDTVVELPDVVWLQPFIGVGAGQYSSRAALIGTGEYLSRASIPFLPDYTSELTARYVMPLVYESNSSTQSPASSWIALYGELGLAGWGSLMLLLFYTVRRFSRFVSPEFPRMSLAMVTLVLYLFLMGFQNVYWEYTQGIFPGVLSLKICHDYVRVQQRVRRVARTMKNIEAQDVERVAAPLVVDQPSLPSHSL